MLRISSSTTPYMPYVSQRPPYFSKKIWCENGMKSRIVFLESRPKCITLHGSSLLLSSRPGTRRRPTSTPLLDPPSQDWIWPLLSPRSRDPNPGWMWYCLSLRAGTQQILPLTQLYHVSFSTIKVQCEKTKRPSRFASVVFDDVQQGLWPA